MDNNNTLRSTPIETPTTPRNLFHTALLAASLLLIPLLLGTLVVVMAKKMKPASAPPPSGAYTVSNRLDEATATNLTRLVELRRDLRNDGLDTEEVNLKIWAAHASAPTVLFRIAPPADGKRWNWHLSQDGRFAVAVSVQTDQAERRAVGLFDVTTDEWVWKKDLPWPDSHETPYVFNRHVVLRYAKNASRFAMEIDSHGAIIGIDSLGKAAFNANAVIPPLPGFPGTPVAIRNGVLFTTAAEDPTLSGYALEKIPGLRYAGKGDQNTLFSGNGLLKFSAQDGIITVSDSLTQTVLQRVVAWQRGTNTVVTGTLVTRDGSQLSVFLKTSFAGMPAMSREWSASLSTYAGTVKPSFNADALLAKPKRSNQKQALSSDGRYSVSVQASNTLVIAAQPQGREVAKLSLGSALGTLVPIDHIAFLEEGRHLVLRQADNFWLLDFAAVRGQADLLARVASCGKFVPMPTPAPTVPGENAATPPVVASPLIPSSTNELACSYLTLRAEWYASHQAWGYAAANLEEAAVRSALDGRAPRVNPLLLAHAYILSGQTPKARLACRSALKTLIDDSSAYNHMIRYQLQGLLFAQP